MPFFHPNREAKNWFATMLDYNKRGWASSLFTLRGTMVHEIGGRVLMSFVWSICVVATHQLFVPLPLDATMHSLVGVALGLLLVFRTNASYDRFWEGRRQWGSIINESRNLGRAARAYLEAAPDLKQELVVWTCAFPHAAKNYLRGTSGVGAMTPKLPPPDAEIISKVGNAPLAVCLRISQVLVRARDRGLISDYVMMTIDHNVQLLIDYYGSCERIYKTPLPFIYVVHLRRALVLYCYTLPFALVGSFGWWAIFATLLISYTFYGIEEIGVEIENPFGLDPSDLPMEGFCDTIERDLREISALPGPTILASAHSTPEAANGATNSQSNANLADSSY